MGRKKYVLWIEDDAAFNLQRLATPVVMNLAYDLTLAITVSEAIHFLQRQPFDAIILDLRLPPGRRKEWITLDRQLARAGEPPRLGLHLLLNLFGQPQAGCAVLLPTVKAHAIEKFGILSIDTVADVSSALDTIDFKHNHFYVQKKAGMTTDTLLQLIRRVAPDQL